MKKPLLVLAVFASFATPICSLELPNANADDSASPSAALEAAKENLPLQTYLLKYKFKKDEVFRAKVVHLVTVETKIQGVSETAKTRSVSTRVWTITDVDAEGNISFIHSVESANMWQSLSGRQEIRFDSQSDEEPPPEYKHVAKSIGVPIASITIKPNGKVIDRKNALPQFNPGIGELTIPFPENPIKVGQAWATEGELPLKMPDARVKKIRIRQVYKLQKVETGVATISMKTQVLTPVNDPKAKSQLVQRIKTGEIKFDIDSGRVISQQMDIDETVIGFNGAESIMKYLSRLTEEMVREKEAKVAIGPQPATSR